MTANASDIEYIRANDKSLACTFTASDAAYDITGLTIYFTVKREPSNPLSEAIISKTVLPAAHTNPTAGLTTVPLSSTDTDFAEGSYYYDFQIVNGSGQKMSSKRGLWIQTQGITP